MKKVYTNENIALVGMSKAYLIERGIDCIIRNEFGSSVMGEVAFFEVWPELWVLNEQDYTNAMILLEGLQQQATIDGPVNNVKKQTQVTLVSVGNVVPTDPKLLFITIM